MYLISIYFDENTNGHLKRYINVVAEKTGNDFMITGEVPPHITIAAFETEKEEEAKDVLKYVATSLEQGDLTWASVGQFFPYVLFLQPVLNEYLHRISTAVFEGISKIEGVRISPYYQPFQWIPHATIGKKLTKEEMRIGFEILQNQFSVFEGKVVRIGLAKTNPYRELETLTF